MIASTDAAIRFLLAPVRVSRSSAGRNGASVFWNRFVAGRQRKMGQA
jgi:hypothetical protein